MQERIGDYKIISELGQGAMATVFKAVRRTAVHGARPLGVEAGAPDEVAIKVLRAEYLDDLGFRARFEREGKTITALQHEAIVPVYEFGQDEQQLYIVMAYMPHGSLAERLLFRDVQDETTGAWAKEVLARVASALDYAHSQGVIHRDLKPSNILFDGEDRAYLGDFGIALQQRGQQARMITGTPAYMSPEQAGVVAGGNGDDDTERGQITPASDIYALGVLAYRLLVGQLPFQGGLPVAVLVQHVQDPPPAPRQVNPALSEGVEQVLLRALAKNPAQRFGSAGEFVEALERGEGGLGIRDWRLGIGDWGLETGDSGTGEWGLGTDSRTGDSGSEIRDWRLGIGGWRARVEEVWESVYGWFVERPRMAFVLVSMLAVVCALSLVGVLRGWGGEGGASGDVSLEAAVDGGQSQAAATGTVEMYLPLAPLQPGLVTPTATAAPTSPAAEGSLEETALNVRILYDSGKVTLLNISDASLALSEIALRRVSGEEVVSPVLSISMLNRVAGGAVDALAPGDCLQLLGREAIQNRRAGKPAECGTLRGWLATRETNQLFEGIVEGQAFEVLHGEQVLQRCPLADDGSSSGLLSNSCQFFVAQEP